MAPLAKKVLDTIERYRPSMRNEDAFKAERSQPSVLFEEKYGFTGLSQQHNLPEGLTFKDLDIYVRVLETAKERGDITHEEFITNLAEITENLEILNPALAALNPDKDNPDKMIAFITGTGSAFSLRDLAFFLSQPTGGKDVHDDPERKAVLGRLERKLSSPGWIPAPETLQDIERQLGKKLQDPDYALPPLGNPTDTEEWVAEQIRTQTNYYFKHLPVKFTNPPAKSGIYRMPGDLEEKELAVYADVTNQGRLGGYVKYQGIANMAIFSSWIVHLNPTLKTLDYDPMNPEHTYSFLRAVTEGKNPAEIQAAIAAPQNTATRHKKFEL